MAQTCTKCSRVNPADASYCYYDGSLLDGHSTNGGPVRAGTQNFANPFVFPSGLICRNFDQLAQACQENWAAAVELLQQGYLETFLGSLGRADLAFGAREASRFPDKDRGLDQLLAKLPTQVLEPPKLHVEPRDVNLGQMQVGDNRDFELHLVNNGARLLYGTVTADDCKWLTLGDAPGTAQKVFQFGGEMVIAVHVKGASLRAGNKPLEGRLLVESNGGNTTITVRVEVPVKPFGEGVLAGAKSPRQIAEKAKAAPKDAAPLFEKGAVANWYKANGWTYPVQGPSAAGLGAVQQFFEALGLTAPPKVEINARQINFQGKVGERLRHVLEVKAQEKRPVFAHATSDQPWLVVERAQLNGRTATIGVTVPSVPNRPGEVLQGKVTVTSNGNQRFVVPVSMNISGSYGQPVFVMEDQAAAAPVFADVQVVSSPIMAAPAVSPVMASPRAGSRPELMPTPVMVEPEGRRRGRQQTGIGVHLLPAGLLALALLCMVIADFFTRSGTSDPGGTKIYPVDPRAQVEPHFLDHPVFIQGRKDLALGDAAMRFGFTMPLQPDNNNDPNNVLKQKRLNFFVDGTSNNTCIKIDGQEYLLGSGPSGYWKERAKELGDVNDGPDGKKRKRIGLKSVYFYTNDKIQVTQTVEVVPSDQAVTVDYNGKKQKMRVLDRAMIMYEIENQDSKPHKVGIRFLLDTFIGTNDGVPFILPGEAELNNTMRDFSNAQSIPDFIQALENADVNNPGTVARITLKPKGAEPPVRVTLGAWPHFSLKDQPGGAKARGHMTMWDVPLLSMQAGGRKDSAITIYWDDKLMQPKDKRVMGFYYGLGNLKSQGNISISMDGNFVQDETFTLTALVNKPQPNQTVTLTLPPGLRLAEGQATQTVPPAKGGSTYSPVSWRILAERAGEYDDENELKVTSSTKDTVSASVTIKKKGGGIFGGS